MGDPTITLFRNPWDEIIPNAELAEILREAGRNMAAELQRLIDDGDVEDGRDSIAVVILDPTRPRRATDFADRVLGVIEVGENARAYVPNAAAKADAHDRHGVPNGQMLEHASHCLGNGDFGWGNSAEYLSTLAGASGLSVPQDYNMAYGVLEYFVEEVRARRDTWLKKRREAGTNQRWFNLPNAPAPEYVSFMERDPLKLTSV